jgi:F-type H+-transporting ATPase subunit f
MQKVVNFYEKLPRGAAPEVQAKGLLGRYQKKYMGKNASGRRTSISAQRVVFLL